MGFAQIFVTDNDGSQHEIDRIVFNGRDVQSFSDSNEARMILDSHIQTNEGDLGLNDGERFVRALASAYSGTRLRVGQYVDSGKSYKYPGQPRDDHGRFGSGGGSSGNDSYIDPKLGVSEGFKAEVKRAISTIDKGLREKLGVKVRVGKSLNEMYPELMSEKPRGWFYGTWAQADGLYHPTDKAAVVTEFRRLENGDLVKNDSIAGTIRHEYGHGVDDALTGKIGPGKPSNSHQFGMAHEEDVKHLLAAFPGSGLFDNGYSLNGEAAQLAYFIQPVALSSGRNVLSSEGRSEAFAEAFAALHGGGCVVGGLFDKWFPRTIRAVHDISEQAKQMDNKAMSQEAIKAEISGNANQAWGAGTRQIRRLEGPDGIIGDSFVLGDSEKGYKYPGQPRDDHGRFGSGGGGGLLAPDDGGANVSGGSGGGKKPKQMHPATYNKKEKEWQLAGGKKLPEHLPKRIPPAWEGVHVALDPKASLLVKGKDAKGRTQSIYSENHAEKQAAKKFARVNELRKKQAAIANEIKKDTNSKDAGIKEAASVLSLIQHTGLRPGGTGDTGAEKQAYGATTLEGRHVVKSTDGVSLQFVGKKGVDLNIPIKDNAIASMLLERKAAAGKDGKLFDTDASALREYTATKDGGGFKPKDFRTARGTTVAAEMVMAMDKPTNEKEYKQAVKEVATAVSKQLGNTPTIALQSYIDPSVFSKWRAA